MYICMHFLVILISYNTQFLQKVGPGCDAGATGSTAKNASKAYNSVKKRQLS